MTNAVLIIGEDPSGIDFDAPDAPPTTAAQIHQGLDGSRDRLIARGYPAEILLTLGPDTLEQRVDQALAGKDFAVIVIGAGLRTLPPMAAQFEKLMNLLHKKAPGAAFAFNSNPADSDAAALRLLEPTS